MRVIVIATCEVVGYHCWPDAPTEVAYLASRHRHVFKIRVEVESLVNNRRSVEFHMLQRQIKGRLTALFPSLEGSNGLNTELEFGNSSCEMIAHKLFEDLDSGWLAVQAVEVWEDGENGARVHR